MCDFPGTSRFEESRRADRKPEALIPAHLFFIQKIAKADIGEKPQETALVEGFFI